MRSCVHEGSTTIIPLPHLVLNVFASESTKPTSPDGSWIIETSALTKVYGQQRSLSEVSLQVPPGTIGFLGQTVREKHIDQVFA